MPSNEQDRIGFTTEDQAISMGTRMTPGSWINVNVDKDFNLGYVATQIRENREDQSISGVVSLTPNIYAQVEREVKIECTEE